MMLGNMYFGAIKNHFMNNPSLIASELPSERRFYASSFEKGAKVVGTIKMLKNPVTWIVVGVLFLLTSIISLALFIAISLGGDNTFDSEGEGGTAQVSADVLRYEPLIRKYAEENGIREYVGLIMALIQQESGGRTFRCHASI